MSCLPELALTVRQPWALFILSPRIGKDIENRTWPTRLRGRVWIHSSKGTTQREIADAINFAEMTGTVDPEALSMPADSEFGAILGSVEIVDCVQRSDSPWFVGPNGFALRNPVRLVRPVQCRGALSFWRVPADVLEQIRGAG